MKGDYAPMQHVAQPQGTRHPTVWASVELYDDDPPKRIILGRHVYILDMAHEAKLAEESS
jgi:hypothetical protein